MGGISGVHHVGIGVKNLETMKSFYRDVLGFTAVFAEFDESEQEVMREAARAPRVVFRGAILGQKVGGIALEFIEMSVPVPRPIRKDFRYGDIGVAKTMLAVADVGGLYEELKGKVSFCSAPKRVAIPGVGDYSFVYCKDPEGNLTELFSTANEAVRDRFGGARGVGIGVTDLERSVSFYQRQLDFEVVVAIHEAFSGLVDEVSGGQGSRVRSCTLAPRGTRDAVVELFEVSGPRGRSIPFAAAWGDLGYLQVALLCDDVRGMASNLEKAGVELLCSPKVMDGGIPEHPGEFVYGRDPDGIPVELLYLP
jgi:catechol 2,3-dioxygenase-like lactoylglutathione lyase family enzyme